ncbi:MAG: hypothetical protein EAZ85_05220 [Bacteroidetes bacterium]|nr:MAG: hypothetical protein EAZ85_05220 [Bacteroidota bacterium]TAG86897.1 MAG: hypothetical protein EAZ20_11800 [Bacteroidota bacterium]
MNEFVIEKRNLYRAIGELSYVIAQSDGRISKVEKLVFEEALKEELDNDGWLAKDRFDMLASQGMKASIQETYHRVLFMFKQNKIALNAELTEKFINILEKVAGVSGITDEEIAIIEKFKTDVSSIL